MAAAAAAFVAFCASSHSCWRRRSSSISRERREEGLEKGGCGFVTGVGVDVVVGVLGCGGGGGVGVVMAGDAGLAKGDLRCGEGWRGLEEA